MKIPGFGDRTTTTQYDPTTGETVRTTTHVNDPVHDPAHAHHVATPGVVAPAAIAGGALTAKELQRENAAAYERGRADQRRAQRSHPILTVLVVLFALLGVTFAALAAINLSFTEAGQVFDGWMGIANQEAQEAAVEARDVAGETVQDAGAALQGVGASVEADAEAARR